jgi:hypothetical protein
MPRTGTIPNDIASYLRRRPRGASTAEIVEALRGIRRSEVLPHSVRSALYAHLGDKGERLFVRLDRGRYGIRT